MPTDHPAFFIGGEWVAPRSAGRIDVVGASTGEILGSVPEGCNADIDAAVDAARTAFEDPTGWSTWEPAQRAEVMCRLADALEKRSEEITRVVTAQNGMPIWQSQMLEGGLPGMFLRYYADLIRDAPDEEVRPGMLGGSAHVRREPMGVVAAIVPWNVPQTLAATKYAPALAAGCTLVIKPSPETVLDAILLAEAVVESGVPAGVINIVPAGRSVPRHPPRHRQGGVHRVYGSRSDDRRRLRRAAASGDPGARWEVGRHHPGGRRPQ